jgi:hypothetical protein
MRARILALALALAPAACDEAETVITHVDRRGGFERSSLWAIQDARGIPVEVHGSPFRNISDLDVVEALRPPAGGAQDVTFYARPPGGWVQGYPWRLVLHFNPQGAPNAVADCKRVAEARTDPPLEGSFTVMASFCERDEWAAQGHLQALRIEDGDLEAFADMMAQLIATIVREEPAR